MDNRSRKFLWLLIIIDYQYQSIIDGNRSINIIDCYQYAISIDYLFSQTFQLSISSSTNKVTHFDIIAFYLGIPHGRSRWTWASAQTYKERRRKRNNIKFKRVWTTTSSQVSWIFAMNSKLNRSSLYYWQRDMLIVLIICAVFQGATSMNNILKLCYWGLKIIYDLCTLLRYLRRHKFSANRWQSMKFATT